MTVRAQAGTFAAAGTWGAASTHDITGLGFQPSLVLFFDLGAALDAVNSGLLNVIGMSDGTNNVSASTDFRDGVATTAASKSLRNDVCYYYYTAAAGARGSFSCAMLADGFRLTVATTFSAFARQIGYLAIGGLTNAKVGARAFPAGTGTFDTIGLGFQPDCLLVAMPNEATVPDADSFTSGLGFGVATANAQAGTSFSGSNGAAASNTRSRWNTAALLTQLTPSADTVEIEAAFSAFIADGFTLDKTVGTRTDGFIWAAFQGGNPELLLESTRTTAGNIVRTGLSVTPAGLLLFGAGHAATSETTPTVDAWFGLGAASGSSAQCAFGSVAPDALSPTESDTISASDRAWLRADVSAGTAFIGSAVSLVSLDSNGYTLGQSTLDAAAKQFAVLAFGEAASTGLTFYLLDSAASNSGFGSLQKDGTAPAAATTNTGWQVGALTPPNYALQDWNSKRTTAGFSTTAVPSVGPDSALGDCWRSSNPLSGAFAAGDWQLSVAVRAVDQGGTQDGKLRFRLWRSTQEDGSGATEITSGTVQTTEGVNISTGVDSILTALITLGAVTLVNEYLFLQLAWEITGAA